MSATVSRDDIEDRFKNSLASLHQASKLALLARKQAQENLDKAVTKAGKYENQLKAD